MMGIKNKSKYYRLKEFPCKLGEHYQAAVVFVYHSCLGTPIQSFKDKRLDIIFC